jgi:hypothetical protein
MTSNVMQARLSRLMVATQQLRGKYDMKVQTRVADKGVSTRSKQWLYSTKSF